MVGVMPTPETNERSTVMTLKQAAEYLRISKAHLSNILRGKVLGVPPLRCAHVGRRTLIKLAWADEWLEELGESSTEAKC